MKTNRLMVAGMLVTVIGLLIVVKHEMGIPGYWTPLLVGIGLLIAGAIRSLFGGKTKTS